MDEYASQVVATHGVVGGVGDGKARDDQQYYKHMHRQLREKLRTASMTTDDTVGGV